MDSEINQIFYKDGKQIYQKETITIRDYKECHMD